LIKDIKALGKPVVLVLLNGSALAINWENANVPAILEAWYPGQAAGRAIADVLFGDYNPGGRLPVTFYKSEKDLPAFTDYALTSQTYRYFKGDPLYPFGFGLSYTNFEYSNLKLDGELKGGQEVKLSVDIKNMGAVDGDEVAQVYTAGQNLPGHLPLRSLKAFRRIHLKAGETRKVDLVIPADAFLFLNEKNEKTVVPGNYVISIGGGQPDVKLKTSSNVLKQTVNIKI
jgi:beta-glucosidase